MAAREARSTKGKPGLVGVPPWVSTSETRKARVLAGIPLAFPALRTYSALGGSVEEHRESTHEQAERFIPYLRDDLVGMCLDEQRLTGEFLEVSGHLVDYLHCRSLRDVTAIKRHYAPFDPDREVVLAAHDAETLAHSEQELVHLFERLAGEANYFPIDRAFIEKCFDRETLIKIRTRVDLDDFERVSCFARGDVFKSLAGRRFFRTESRETDIFRRVLLLLKFKGPEYFEAAGKKLPPGIAPGGIFLYLYKDVPKYDLELLFPNVKVGMRLKDKLMLGIPAIGGSVGVLLKILPQVVVLTGLLLFFLGARSVAENFGVTAESAVRLMPALTALMGVTMALGGLAFKQWTSFQKKRIEFLRQVAEHLFFRNLAMNRSVFHRVIDSAEEEESKEMILVLHHLFTSQDATPTRAELDGAIETWMRERFETVIDFDIDGALGNLMRLRGSLPDGRTLTLLTEDPDGRLQVLPLEDARILLAHLATERFNHC